MVGSKPPVSGPEGGPTREDLVEALDRLRRRAARGSGRRRVSLESIAQSTGIPRSTVHSYVRGTRLPPADALDAIVVALGARPAEQALWAATLERLRDAPSLRRAPTLAALPRQLPARPAGFVGRTRELAELGAAARRAATDEDAPAVIALTGIGGVGKTALVLQWAHQAAELFPDGQLWLDLRAFSAGPALEATDALERLLRAVGVGTTELPADVDARAAMFRTAVAGRRMLLVVDNARDSDHVRPLLPGTAGFVTVVTSRDALRPLVAREGAHRLQVERLPMAAALQLLSTGLPMVAGRAEAERIAARCDGLPLALRIVRERLSRERAGDLQRLTAELEGESAERLAALELDDSEGGGVRSVMQWSYRSLAEPAAVLFRRLPLCLAPTFDVDAARVLLDVERGVAGRLLEHLVAANLLDVAGFEQFRLHDLVAAYAVEQLRAEEPEGEIFAARVRFFEYLVSSTEEALAACDRERPIRLARPDLAEPALRPAVAPFATAKAAQEWTARHTDTLLAAVVDAAEHGPVEYAWVLAERGWRAMWFFGNVSVFEPAIRTMQDAARRAGVSEPARLAPRLLAIGYAQTARMDEAVKGFEEAMALASAAGDTHSARLDLANLAMVRGITGDVTWAIGALTEVVDAAPDGAQDQFPSLTSIVELELQRGDLEAARRFAKRAATSPAGRGGSSFLELEALLAGIDIEARHWPAARPRLEALVAECRRAGNPQMLSQALERLSFVFHQLGELDAAEVAGREALAVGERIGYRSREIEAEATLGDVVREAGRPAEALAFCERALTWARESRARYAECRTLLIAGQARRDVGDRGAAIVDLDTALEIAKRCGYRQLEVRAAEVLAELAVPSGRAAGGSP